MRVICCFLFVQGTLFSLLFRHYLVFTSLYSSQSYPYDTNTVYNPLEDLEPETVSDAYTEQDYVENDVQGSFKAANITYGGFIPCNTPSCAKVYTTTIALETTTEETAEQETYNPINYAGGTIHGTLVKYNHGSAYISTNHLNTLGTR